ncbi:MULTISPECIES: mechanosensitive ion channel domain-containing protein [unclassified Lentimonas]|uniref:mechanosensitive ion channel domain-containing protein n=1 Tax=unclassified Lentimonas TaxID=2630993 RepID=UPI001320A284|nr:MULTISPECIES: mechanosensitive ion channel domain-containing protein [unclassified Lentimonas]CAA6693876.1 Unannotated [Lentimonas sp. CC19]CAA6695190.1 Unannotated [Lentimonas sp. CC10]CAA7069732.1 Unannotated [Lentimonas sp. CC11]
MTKRRPLHKTLVVLAAAISCALNTFAQEAPTTAAAPQASNATAPATLSSRAAAIQNAQQALLTLQADTTLDEAARTLQQEALTDAIQHYNNAEGNEAKTAALKATAQTAKTDIATTQQQLEDLSTVQQARIISDVHDLEALEQQAETARDSLTELNQSKIELQKTLEELERRPQEITSRLVKANGELNSINAALTVNQSEKSTNLSKQTLLAAQKDDLTTEIEMLRQEVAGQSDQNALINSKVLLTGRQIENTKAALDSIDHKLNRARMSKAERVIAEVADLVEAAAGKGEQVDQLSAEVTELAQHLKESTNQLQALNRSYDEMIERTADLHTKFSQFEREINIGGLDGILSKVYIEQRRALPSIQQVSFSIKQRVNELRNTRLKEFSLHAKVLNQKEYRKQFRAPLEAEVEALLDQRNALLKQAADQQRAIFKYMTNVDLAERDYAAVLKKVRTYFNEKLFWKKSSAPLWEIQSIDIGGAAKWLIGMDRLVELQRRLSTSIQTHRYQSGFFAIILAGLILSRPRIKRLVKERGRRIQNTSTDCFSNTWWAAYGTVLLSLPIPLVIGALSWTLGQDPHSSDWLQGISKGLHWCFIIATWTCFLIACCAREGLGINHFGWHKESARNLRRCLYSFLIICIPSMLVVCSMVYEETALHFDSVGRIGFIMIMVWAFWILRRLLKPTDGIFSQYQSENPDRFETRTAPLWSLLLIASPIALIILTVQGYFITSLALALELLAIIGLITFGSVCYYFALRWFMIKERKIALEEAIKERNERIEANRKKDDSEQSTEPTAPAGTPELDLEKVGQQTRSMLRSLFTIAVIVEIWFLVTHTLPIDEALGSISYRGWLRPLDLFYASAILIIMTVVVKNLPGLLELSGLRQSKLDVGARYAITTISQYIAGAFGLALVCNVLHVNWSMFGWIATALSVGLGFGLQEIVSNFVCGIILLFERPIRIGDIITINNVTGTVSRIRMRATTIINWDRQELIVPNKQFISDALINWTLTNSVNRTIITVGVAYGTDTIRAKEILTQIAKQHPLTLEDPAPLATFEEFGDSSLLLRLRVYLPDLTDRINVISNLHDTIDQRFKAAGIEIAFPQQDLHIRSIDDTVIQNTGIQKP